MLTEVERIISMKNGEQPLNDFIKFEVSSMDGAAQLEMIKAVIIVVSNYNVDNWPDDQKWKEMLPKWFIGKITSYTTDELLTSNDNLWDYGSWLDAMKFRGWEWYSSKITSLGFEIILVPIELPYSLDPLKYVIYETGVNGENIFITETL